MKMQKSRLSLLVAAAVLSLALASPAALAADAQAAPAPVVTTTEVAGITLGAVAFNVIAHAHPVTFAAGVAWTVLGGWLGDVGAKKLEGK